MLAIIKTGGKQYVVTPGQKIKIEKIEEEIGKEITFNEVLFLREGDKVNIGNPLVKDAKVIGKVLAQTKGKKVIALRYKAKKRQKVKKGHRQPFTEIEITKISA